MVARPPWTIQICAAAGSPSIYKFPDEARPPSPPCVRWRERSRARALRPSSFVRRRARNRQEPVRVWGRRLQAHIARVRTAPSCGPAGRSYSAFATTGSRDKRPTICPSTFSIPVAEILEGLHQKSVAAESGDHRFEARRFRIHAVEAENVEGRRCGRDRGDDFAQPRQAFLRIENRAVIRCVHDVRDAEQHMGPKRSGAPSLPGDQDRDRPLRSARPRRSAARRRRDKRSHRASDTTGCRRRSCAARPRR